MEIISAMSNLLSAFTKSICPRKRPKDNRADDNEKQCSESIIEMSGNQVTKSYNAQYFSWSKKYNRRGEAYFLKKYKSPYFIKLLSSSRDQITLERMDIVLGSINRIDGPNVEHLLEYTTFEHLLSWLLGLKGELKRLRIKHRDIHPGNIMYSIKNDTFKLADFNWAVEADDKHSPAPPYLNPIYGQNDSKAIDRMLHELSAIEKENIFRVIDRVGSQDYKDGSVVSKGWLYQPIPFGEFKKVPVHKNQCVKEYKIISRHLKKLKLDLKSSVLLDIGCSSGYFSFLFSKKFGKVIGIEGDKYVYDVIEKVKRFKRLDNVTFINRYFDSEVLSDIESTIDVALILNVHMWIYKQLGPQKTEILMKELSRKTKHLYFQTSHAQSSGMYIIEDLRDENDIFNYLKQCNFTAIEKLGETDKHGGIRIMYYASSRERS